MPDRPVTERPLLPSLTFRGWALLSAGVIAGIVAYATGWRELLFIGVVCVLIVAISVFVVAFRPSDLVVRRSLSPAVIGAGQRVGVRLEVVNTSWVPQASVQWADVVPRDVEGDSGGLLPGLAPRGAGVNHATLDYSATVAGRGVIQMGPLALRATDPFGLCRHDSTVGGSDELVVLPRTEPLDRAQAASASADDSAVRAALAGRGQDDVVAREYRTGDALRHVHWRATAHRGELMVRQEQRHDEARAVVLLDNDADSWASRAAFEWAVSFAASVVVHLSSDAAGVDLVLTAPDHPTRDSVDRERPIREVMIDLATVKRRAPRSADPHLHELDRLSRDVSAPIVAVVGRLDAARWSDLAARRGARASGVVVFVDTPEVPEKAWSSGWRVATVQDPHARMADVWQQTAARSGRG